MSILAFNFNSTGQIGVEPRRVTIKTNDSLATITAANYLQGLIALGNSFYPSDEVVIAYGTNSDTVQTFGVTLDGTDITLNPTSSAIALPTTANYFAVYSDTNGSLKNGSTTTAINPGSVQAGLSGTAGQLVSYPATAASGKFVVGAVNNSGDFTTTLTHVALGQNTNFLFPDPAAALANVGVLPTGNAWVTNDLAVAAGANGLLKTAGARILAGTTPTYGGGGTSNAFAVTGLTSAAKGAAVIRTSTNNVSIVKAVPGTDTLTITFSADPGANTTVDYNYLTATLS